MAKAEKGGGYIILTVEFRKTDKRWTARCVELGTATFGRSLDEAKKKIGEAILLQLNTLEDVGERERFFKDQNIKFYPHKPKAQRFTTSMALDERIFVQKHLQPIPAHATT